MVDYPKPSGRIVTVEEPRDRVTAALVAAPFHLLSTALDQTGQGLGKVAAGLTASENAQVAGAAALVAGTTKFAAGLDEIGKTAEHAAVAIGERAGREAGDLAGSRTVTTDENGLPKLEFMPDLSGRGGAAYNRAAANSYLARLSPAVDRAVTEKRIEHAADPQAFSDWATGYVGQLVTNAGDNEPLKQSVRSLADNATGQAYRGLLLQKHSGDVQTAHTSLKARLADLDNQAAALARQGGTDTVEYKQRQADIAAIYGELTANPLFKYPEAQAISERTAMESRHKAEVVIGEGERLYDRSGRGAAKAFLERALWDPNLNLTEEQRGRYVARGLSALDAKTSDQTAETRAHKVVVTEHLKLLESGAYFDPRTHSDILAKTQRLGDMDSLYKLESWAVMNEQARAFNAASDPERRMMLERASAGGMIAVPKNLTTDQRAVYQNVIDEARRQGVDPTVAASIAYRESKFDPAAFPKDSEGRPITSARGVFQMIRKTRERFGLADDAPAEKQIEAGIRSLKETTAELAGFLGRAPTPAETYVGHFLGTPSAKAVLGAGEGTSLKVALNSARPEFRSPDGRTWGEEVLFRNPWMAERTPTTGALRDWAEGVITRAAVTTDIGAVGHASRVFSPHNPYSSAAVATLTNEWTGRLSKRLDSVVDDAITSMGKRQMITGPELSTMVDWVQVTGNFGAGRKLADFLQTYERGALIADLPGTQRQSIIAGLTAKAATEGMPHSDRVYLDMLHQQDAARAKGLKDDPLSEFAMRGWTPPVSPVDVSAPEALAAELPNREARIRVGQAREPTIDAVPALTVGEATNLRTELTHGDASKASQLLLALRSNLSAETYHATVTMAPIREALDGMVRSYEPTRLNAAMSIYDQLHRADPLGFAKSAAAGGFGEEAERRLMTWQARKDSMSPLEIAEHFKRADDPAYAEARKNMEAEAKKKTPDANEIAGLFSQYRIPGLDWRIPFTGPSEPTGIAKSLLETQFENIFKERYVDLNGDTDKAKKQTLQRIQRMWAPSDLNGGALTYHAPELHYPAMNGSHAWMRKEVETEIAKLTGKPQFSPDILGPVLDPLQQRFGSTLAPTRPLVPNWSYRVVSDQTTESEISRGVPPSYTVLVQDADGLNIAMSTNGRPRRFAWDTKGATATAESRFGVFRQGALLDRELTDSRAAFGVQ